MVTASEPTREQLLRHARLYGCDQVYETGAEYLAGSELARLKVCLLKQAREHRQKMRKWSTWYEGVSAVTDEDLLALHAEPLTASEVALFAGVSVQRVYRALEHGSEPPLSLESGTELSDAI